MTRPHVRSTISSLATHPAILTPGQPSSREAVPEWAIDFNLVNKALSGLGKTMGPGVIANAKAMGVTNLPPELDGPDPEVTPELIIGVIKDVAWHFFPQLTPPGESH